MCHEVGQSGVKGFKNNMMIVFLGWLKKQLAGILINSLKMDVDICNKLSIIEED